MPAAIEDPASDHFYCPRCEWLLGLCKCNRETKMAVTRDIAQREAAAADKPLRTFGSLREANLARQELWGGDQQDAMYRAVELGGEVGELLNVVKKLERERLGLPGSRATQGALEGEIGDVAICLDLLAAKLGINLDQATARKFNATSTKMGFDVRLFVPPTPDAKS